MLLPRSPRRSRRAYQTKHCRGFSLVELSVVVAILAVVAVFGLEGAASFINRTNGQVTRERMQLVDEAIRNYFKVYGRLPCPAVRSATPTTQLSGVYIYGLEDCDNATAGHATAIRSTAGAGYTTGGSDTGGGIYFGAVPFRTLNIPASLSGDGWANKINYAVTKNLTVAGTGSGQFGNSTNGVGGIEIRTGVLEQACGSSSKCQVVADPAASPSTGAAYILFSNGSDQRGAISMRGTTRNACAAAGSNDTLKVDAQNCINADGSTIALSGSTPANPSVASAIPKNVFYDGRYNNGLALFYYFDDYVIWRPRSQL